VAPASITLGPVLAVTLKRTRRKFSTNVGLLALGRELKELANWETVEGLSQRGNDE
jgi:hypothetical protein